MLGLELELEALARGNQQDIASLEQVVARGGWEGGLQGVTLNLNGGKSNSIWGRQAEKAKLFGVKEMDAPSYWTTEVAGLVQRRGPMPSEFAWSGFICFCR